MLDCSLGAMENRRLCGAEHTLKYLPDLIGDQGGIHPGSGRSRAAMGPTPEVA